MPIETNNVVERLRHDLALISLEYAAKGLEREAGSVMQALNLIERQEAERQSLSDRIDVLEGALDPFARVARLHDAAGLNSPDDYPCREFFPGIWPTLGDCRKAASLTQGGKNAG
jgi:hypothetical protein